MRHNVYLDAYVQQIKLNQCLDNIKNKYILEVLRSGTILHKEFSSRLKDWFLSIEKYII